MTATLEAPSRMGSRSQAAELLRDLPPDLAGMVVEIVFDPRAYPTTSFLDEVIRSVLRDRGARLLVFTNANERVVEIAEQSADDLRVRARLTLNRAA
jgi:hypothetical protein